MAKYIKILLLVLSFMITYNNAFSQIEVEDVITNVDVRQIDANKLYNLIKNDSSCILIKFWIPSCKSANEQFIEYLNFSRKYNTKIYYIGITNQPNLLRNIAYENNFSGTLYMLDTNLSKNIYMRPQIFCTEFLSKYNIHKNVSFNIILLNKNKEIVYRKDIVGFPKKLKNYCR